MIPIPPPVCLGQKITVDGYNQLLDVMRAMQPIGGAGILLEETSNGIIFKLAEPPQSVSVGAFNHRWKCSLIGNETDGYKIHIAPGDLYLISGNGAKKQTLLLGDDIEEDQAQGGWITKEGELSSGSQRLALLVTSEGFYKLSTLEVGEGESVLYIIASIKGPSSSNTTPSFTQLLFQDLYYWQGGTSTTQSVPVVTGVFYDETTHQLFYQYQYIFASIDASVDTKTQVIAEAVTHSGEHPYNNSSNN